ncbi:MAG: polysaccharide deacetylase family protein [Acidobacteria bacterium]|jgi:peptidoglycan/xylan/chitin deacetylase (PgdA/CDA1 family)|nr:polysaccharide deacetylase family protein [Acidobacteriota bacterium]
MSFSWRRWIGDRRRGLLYRSCLAAPARTVVLRYHSIGEASAVAGYLDPGLSLEPRRFAEQLSLLGSCCQVIGVDELPERLAGSGPRRLAVALTFDDGYRDNHDEAMPRLVAAGLRATFYVTTTPLRSGRGLWISELWRLVPRLPAGEVDLQDGAAPITVPSAPERTGLRRHLTARLAALAAAERDAALDRLAGAAGRPRGDGLAESFMRPEHVTGLRAAGMAVGAHTRSHPHLDRLDPQAHDDEVAGARDDLERLLAEPIRHFAYPNPGGTGTRSATARESVRRAGFETAVTSMAAPAGATTDRLQIPRLGVYPPSERQLFRAIERAATRR